MNPAPVQFLDVQALLERSHPRPQRRVAMYVLGVALLLIMLGSYLAADNPAARSVIEAAGVVLMVGLMTGLMFLSMNVVRAHRAEGKRLEAIEELVQLRRWEQAAGELQSVLSQPTRTPGARIQALLYLSTVLNRYHRFHDAISVQTELLDTVQLDPATAHSLKLGLAMALLREDRLVDAGQVMSGLKRESSGESGGLTLVELYRDVRTYHATEAIELFHAKLPQLQKHLGFRVGDAWGLVAWAYDATQQPAEARKAWDNALLLGPADELTRRYPELKPVAEKFAAVSSVATLASTSSAVSGEPVAQAGVVAGASEASSDVAAEGAR